MAKFPKALRLRACFIYTPNSMSVSMLTSSSTHYTQHVQPRPPLAPAVSSKTAQGMVLASTDFPKRRLASCSRANLCFQGQPTAVATNKSGRHHPKRAFPKGSSLILASVLLGGKGAYSCVYSCMGWEGHMHMYTCTSGGVRGQQRPQMMWDA